MQRLAWAGLFTIEVQPAILQRVVETVASGSTLIVVRLNIGHRNRCKYDKTVRGQHRPSAANERTHALINNIACLGPPLFDLWVGGWGVEEEEEAPNKQNTPHKEKE